MLTNAIRAGEKYQKHGYAKEAVHCILTEYLIKQNFYLIEAKCNETNTASRKILEQSGFQAEGRLRDRRMNHSAQPLPAFGQASLILPLNPNKYTFLPVYIMVYGL